MKNAWYNNKKNYYNGLEVLFMNITDIISFDDFNKVSITDKPGLSITQITDEPLYVESTFNEIHTSKESSIILFSAPGAVGKSALAKYIAYLTGGIYWDLSKIKLADNSFIGTMFVANGSSNIDSFLKGVSQGTNALIIDAFDEAEMISGKSSLENLVKDIIEHANPMKSVFLFSRTETADFLSSCLLNLGVGFSHYEINYFDRNQAIKFTQCYLEKGLLDSLDETKKLCIISSLETLDNSLNDNDESSSFTGYAPVLQAIATSIHEVTNYMDMLNQLKKNNSSFSLIKEILKNIMKREQEKLVSALRQRCLEIVVPDEFYTNFYTVKEQVHQIMYFLWMKEICVELPKTEFLGSDDYEKFKDNYEEVLKAFVPQHPFIKSNNGRYDFVGAAFKDYTIVMTLLDDEISELAEEYYSENAKLQSPLFWLFYLDENKNILKSTHFSYLLNAYNSKLKSKCSSEIDIFIKDNQTYADFATIEKADDYDENNIIENRKFQVEMIDDTFVFQNMINVSMSVDSKVCISGSDVNTYLSNSYIKCDSINIRCRELFVENYDESETTIITNDIALVDPSMKINVRGDGKFTVSSKDIETHPKLFRYKSDITENQGDITIEVFVHHLHTIFSKFRTHKKDMPAKDAEFIDFVVIASNPIKKRVFDFLIKKEIVFRSEHLYKLNLDKMSEYKINREFLHGTDLSQMEPLFMEYLNYIGE